MGASWRPGAAALLLLLAAALAAPAARAGSAQDPEVTDAAGDQAIDRGTVPTVPSVNEPSFDDVDVVAAWFQAGHVIDCVGEPKTTCPPLQLVVKTTAAWGSGSMAITFKVA